jgi:hypothetical protein
MANVEHSTLNIDRGTRGEKMANVEHSTLNVERRERGGEDEGATNKSIRDSSC